MILVRLGFMIKTTQQAFSAGTANRDLGGEVPSPAGFNPLRAS
jgi:hypothetical protein